MSTAKQRKARDRELNLALRAGAKPLGWKLKASSLYRVEQGWFIEVRVHRYPADEGFRLKAYCSAKPMAVDPVWWDASGMHDMVVGPVSRRADSASLVAPRHTEVDLERATAAELANALLRLAGQWTSELLAQRDTLMETYAKGFPPEARYTWHGQHELFFADRLAAGDRAGAIATTAARPLKDYFGLSFADFDVARHVDDVLWRLALPEADRRTLFRLEAKYRELPFDLMALPSEIRERLRVMADAKKGTPRPDWWSWAKAVDGTYDASAPHLAMLHAWLLVRATVSGVHIDDVPADINRAQSIFEATRSQLDERPSDMRLERVAQSIAYTVRRAKDVFG